MDPTDSQTPAGHVRLQPVLPRALHLVDHREYPNNNGPVGSGPQRECLSALQKESFGVFLCYVLAAVPLVFDQDLSCAPLWMGRSSDCRQSHCSVLHK